MKITRSVLATIGLLAITAQAQETKIEIAPYAGGYFSAGFQSARIIELGATPTSREFRPVDEPNSGIFGVRGSYDLTRRITLEGAFGFSPAGREVAQSSFAIPLIASAPPNLSPVQEALIATVVPTIRGKDTFNYSGNVLLQWRKARGWTPFITGGLGAITRTAEIAVPTGPTRPILPILPIRFRIVVPSPTETDFSVNFGGGLKKYFSSRCGIRLDFRNYVSQVGEDTVNNMEVSLGVIFRM